MSWYDIIKISSDEDSSIKNRLSPQRKYVPTNYTSIGHESGTKVILFGYDGNKVYSKEIVTDEDADGIVCNGHQESFSNWRDFIMYGRIEKDSNIGTISMSYKVYDQSGNVRLSYRKEMANGYAAIEQAFPTTKFYTFGGNSKTIPFGAIASVKESQNIVENAEGHTYLGIGHNHGLEVIIWGFDGKQLHQFKTITGRDEEGNEKGHRSFNNKLFDTFFFAGRVDLEGKIGSISVQTNFYDLQNTNIMRSRYIWNQLGLVLQSNFPDVKFIITSRNFHIASSDLNWYKKAQVLTPQQMQMYRTFKSPSGINLKGSGLSAVFNIPGTNQTLNGSQILNQVIARIRNVLIQNNVQTIDTNPVARADALGVAISSEPGTIHVDLDKIFKQVSNQTLPSISQLDGVEIDRDIQNDIINQVSKIIINEVANVTSHESKHNIDYFNSFPTGQFTSPESGAVSFGDQIARQYFS